MRDRKMVPMMLNFTGLRWFSVASPASLIYNSSVLDFCILPLVL